MTLGRPSLYTDAIADTICDQLEQGVPLAEICRQPGMPAARTVRDWVGSREDFGARYAEARAVGFDVIASDCLAIADDGSRDYAEQSDGHGGTRVVVDHDHIQRSKLRVDTRLKLLAKWDPKRYGDRLDLGGVDDSPLRVIVRRMSPPDDAAPADA